MWLSFVTTYLLINNGLVQSADKKNEFVDIRSVYHYSTNALSRLDAQEVCLSYSAWLVAFDHHNEFLDVTNFFRQIPVPLTGDPIKIQTCGSRNGTAKESKFHYQWNYPYKIAMYNVLITKWCVVYDQLHYPLEIEEFRCLMLTMGKDKTWCYKNYDCKDHVPFLCEKRLSTSGAAETDGDKKGAPAKVPPADKKGAPAKEPPADKKGASAKEPPAGKKDAKEPSATVPPPDIGHDNVISDGSK